MYYIYRITNLVNGKTYIGQHRYKKLDDNYMGSGVALGRAQKKYGIENFKKEILVFNILKVEHANILEETFIASEREKVGRENCYNITNGGDGFKGIDPWNKGKKGVQTAWNKGIPMSEEQKKYLSELNKGRPSPRKGKHHTEESKQKMRESHKGQVAWNKGVPMSEEQKQKLSEYNKANSIMPPSQKCKYWFNNGEKSIMSFECPEGFTPGRIYHRKKGDKQWLLEQ